RAAGGAAGRAREIIRIVRGAVDVVIALPVAEPERHVGLAKDDAARVLDACDRQGVFLRDEILLRHKPPGRRQASDVVGFLDGEGQAEQRPVFAARERSVRSTRRLERAVEIAYT